MSTKPPVSWTSIEEGKDALIESGGDTDKAVKKILDRQGGKGGWTKDYKKS